MKISLFDSDLNARNLWTDVCLASGMEIETHLAWSGISSDPMLGAVFIVDQSAFSGGVVKKLLNFLRSTDAVVVASGHSFSVNDAVLLMRAGALSVLEKPLIPEDLCGLLSEAQALAAQRKCQRRSWEELRSLFASLTRREWDVHACLMAGMSNKDIAEKLCVSVRTVESRRAKLYRKLEAAHIVDVVLKTQAMQGLAVAFGKKQAAPDELAHEKGLHANDRRTPWDQSTAAISEGGRRAHAFPVDKLGDSKALEKMPLESKTLQYNERIRSDFPDAPQPTAFAQSHKSSASAARDR